MATRALQQVIAYVAWNTSTNVFVTGDSANHSTSWCKDGTRSATTNATAEVDATNLPGLYKVTVTATETDCIEGVLGGKSTTANVVLIPTMVAFDYLNTAAPATAGVPDVNVKNINNVAAATPGAAGGVFIAGTNAPVTITGSGDALTISSTAANGNAINLSGNGSGDAFKLTGGATGNALELIGGATSGDGLKVTTTLGHGFNVAATGSSKHGATFTGGSAGTSDGFKAVAGTGGVDIRGNITGNLVGTVSTLTTYTGNTPQTGDGFARIGVAGVGLTNLGDTRIAHLDADVSSRMATFTLPSNFSALGISAGGHISNVDTLTTYTGDTPQTGDGFARLGAPAGASVSADIAAIKSDTGTILTDVNTGAGAIYTRIGAPAGASIAADIAAVNAKTTNLPASPAAVGSAMTLTAGERNSVADALLDRDMSVGTDSGSTTVRTPRQALRLSRNKVAIAAGTMTVTKEDDSTTSWTSAITTDPTAQPIVTSDPAGP